MWNSYEFYSFSLLEVNKPFMLQFPKSKHNLVLIKIVTIKKIYIITSKTIHKLIKLILR